VLTPGQRLRVLREDLGFSIWDVETASTKIAERHRLEDFAISVTRLSEIESKGVVPSIYRLYSLSTIYRRDLREFLSWYGVDLNDVVADVMAIGPAKSHRVESFAAVTAVHMPIRLEPGFDPRKTMNLGRFIEQWGTVPLAFLTDFAKTSYTYGYIGSEDYTMYPLLPPGSFLQIDESKNEVVNGVWRSEFERPIYFLETRGGYICSWCTAKKQQLILQPHPLAPVPVRIFECPKDAEVVGQVVGIATRLGDWRPRETVPNGTEATEWS